MFTEAGDFERMATEDQVRILLSNREATLVRDRKGTIRRVVLIASVSIPLRGQSKLSAIGSYFGVKFTYEEELESSHPIHMLKRYNQRTGEFIKWPGARRAA